MSSSERLQERKQELFALLGGICNQCGTNENLQFDHVDPAEKSFTIGKHLSRPMQVLVEEALKCVLLCEDCHKVKTRKNWEFGSAESLHGTLWRYKKYKCRCQECKDAMSDWYYAKKLKNLL